ncbi:ribonucleotide reductase inhibitor [Plectosphaerella cucumerina]|uniref:Ribonucleotide reductase inhibitor n=1 Tax=Plectosphaerella cucumerina TaxID=40658 RepID=A0A8K0TGE7_9PEZI|nr:ribonucleotide reductase inhibitor [Plectosphaerella cucumerina]
MSHPRTKRQFAGAASDPTQRQITSFFSPSSLSPLPSSQNDVEKPVLPDTVQTNLLSVGMRVRKSVPEGYKTGTPYSGFKLWSDADTSLPMCKAPSGPRRELLPFCGIHSIGGLSSQPSREEDDLPSLFVEDEDGVPGLDDVPGLTSSQETVDSNPPSVTGSQTGRRKRFFDDAEEDDGTLAPRQWSDRSTWMEGDVSPRSLTPVGWSNSRTIAVPRKQGRRKAGVAVVGSSYEQENTTANDFGEADFLVGEGMDTTGL